MGLYFLHNFSYQKQDFITYLQTMSQMLFDVFVVIKNWMAGNQKMIHGKYDY